MFLVLCFSIPLIISTYGQEGPKVSLLTPSIKPKIGSKSSLTCQALSGTLPLQISWFKDGKEIREEVNSMRIRTNEDISNLVIDSISSSHSGNYTCKISNRFGSDFGSIELKLEGPPSWNDKPENIKIRYGEYGLIKCSGKGWPKPKVEWKIFKGSSWLRLDNLGDGIIESDSLIIEKASTQHSGRYGCTVTNGIEPHLISEFNIEIEGKLSQ